MQRLRSADTVIRQRLRERFEQESTKFRDENGKPVSLQPRFWRQGSSVYGTMNTPAYTPPQQIDLDDGTYLPMSFMKDVKPGIASEAFIKFVDSVLIELVDDMNWKEFVPKDTCARVVIDDAAHVDVPLYAIPDSEYQKLEKAAAMRVAARVNLAEQTFKIDPSSVYLAHREKKWVLSDPRKLHHWFTAAVDNHGEQLRRISRILKSWRDEHEDIDKLTSILIMVCVWKVFESPIKMPPRDDLAMLSVLKALPQLLLEPIENPTDPNELLTDRIPDSTLATAATRAANFHDDLRICLNMTADQNAVIRTLRKHLGSRVPNRTDLVEYVKPRNEVSSHPPKIVPAPVGTTNKSG